MPGFLQLYLNSLRASSGPAPALPTLGEVERRYIEFVLDLTRRNKTETARILNISRRALYYKLAGYMVLEAGAGPGNLETQSSR